MRYVLWNNKGGVGKSLLSFILATEYAQKHQDTNVVVIDMCPQGNVSQMLLGGVDSGSDVFFDLVEQNKTVLGYMLDRARSPYKTSGTELNYHVNVSKHNNAIPNNLYLVPSHPALDLMSDILEQNATNKAVNDAWKLTYSWIADLQNAFITFKGAKTVFFIDTNPSFSNYTKLAIMSADRLIVPCFADIGSMYALDNIMYLLYGAKQINLPFSNESLCEIATKNEMIVPLIHMVIQGKATRANQKQAKAFANIGQKLDAKLEDLQQRYNGQVFCRSMHKIKQTLDDLNSVAPIISQTGRIISTLSANETPVVSDSTIKVSTDIKKYQDEVKFLIELLG